MLAAQMAEVHLSNMDFARRVARADNLALLDISERTFNKLARILCANGGTQALRIGR
jgi:hypothetical protein